MEELRKGNRNMLVESCDQELEDHNVNLRNYQWRELDELSREKEVSRNQVLRDILDEFFSDNSGDENVRE